VIEMGIPDSPQAAMSDSAGGSNEGFREEVSDAEIQRDVTPPEVPDQSCEPEVRQTTLPDTTRLRKGVGTKRKANGLQEGGASKRPYVEEGDDFLLNEISLAVQNFGLLEFTWWGEPLSPLSPTGGTRVVSEPSQEPLPAPDAHMCREETAEALEVISPGTRAKNSASGAEGGSQGEGLDQRTPLDPGVDAPVDRPLGETPVPSTSGVGFDFLGIRLLGDPLEALASVLPDGLFEDVGKTTPFKFAQDIVESQIAVPFFRFLLITAPFFPLVISHHFLFFLSKILFDPLQLGPTFWSTCAPTPT